MSYDRYTTGKLIPKDGFSIFGKSKDKQFQKNGLRSTKVKYKELEPG